jgi:hypothetical protein
LFFLVISKQVYVFCENLIFHDLRCYTVEASKFTFFENLRKSCSILEENIKDFCHFSGTRFLAKKALARSFFGIFFFLESGLYDGLLDLLTGGIWHDDRCISCVICYSLFVSAWGRGQGGLRPKKG